MGSQSLEFVSCGVNSHAKGICENGQTLAYAAGPCIALLKEKKVHAMLKGHISPVRVVQWYGNMLISGDSVGQLKVWNKELYCSQELQKELHSNGKVAKKLHSSGNLQEEPHSSGNLQEEPRSSEKPQEKLHNGGKPQEKLHNSGKLQDHDELHCSQTLQDHEGAINAIAVSREREIVATACALGWFTIYRVIDNKLQKIDAIFSQPLYILSMVLVDCKSSNSSLLVAAGTSKDVWIYGSARGVEDWSLKAKLKGHDDWIRSLHARTAGNITWIASAGQDKFIRLWKIYCSKDASPQDQSKQQIDSFSSSLLLSNKVYAIELYDCTMEVKFEALLIGHDDWITSVQWHEKEEKLLSSSADNSVMIWEPEAESGVWICTVRLGDAILIKGATTATGSSGGFWESAWLKQGQQIACVGKNGALRFWEYANSDWVQGTSVTGHSAEVTGISWDPNGHYIMSVSSDQTTRLWARDLPSNTWKEFSRAQIHGYDLNAVQVINSITFASGADEKVIRVFQMPKNVASILSKQCDITQIENLEINAAAVPLLGLSNKANQKNANNEDTSSGKDDMQDLSGVPLEAHLQRHTIWPELEKLYGHGYEISAVSCSNNGKVLATACRATSASHSVIRMYCTEDWREILPPLEGHSLTIQRLRFSKDDKYLLSVSRDRKWCIHEVTADNSYKTVAHSAKAHLRIIWDCCWIPEPSSYAFATVSRDKTCKIWKMNGGEFSQNCAAEISHDYSVTAVDCRTNASNHAYLAFGNEMGNICIYLCSDNQRITWSLHMMIADTYSPSLLITEILWRPITAALQLAVASSDNSLRILNITE